MKCHYRIDPSVNDGIHYLPHYLYQTYPPGVCNTFGNKDQDGPAQLRQEHTMISHVLYSINKFLPLGWVGGGGRFPYCVGFPQPPLDVFTPEVGVSLGSCLVSDGGL